MKQLADTKQRDVNFNVENWVMVKLHSHHQSTLFGTLVAYSKLAKRYYGPHQILERIGKAAYKLQLLEGAHVHHVFHCSLLEPFRHSTTDLVSPLPLSVMFDDNQTTITPLVIVGIRQDPASIDPKLKVLVQWDGLPPDDTSWEDCAQLKVTYHLEDKVILYGIGNDMKNKPQP